MPTIVNLNQKATVNSPFQICIFEDHDAKNATPYQLTRPVYTIPHGMHNLVEKLRLFLPEQTLTLLCQPSQALFLKKRFPTLTINQLNKSLPTLYVNGRLGGMSLAHLNTLLSGIQPTKNQLFINNNSVPMIYATGTMNTLVFGLLQTQPTFDAIMGQLRKDSIVSEKKYLGVTTHWWDYLTTFSSVLNADFDTYSKRQLIEGDIASFSTLINDTRMSIASTATIAPYTVLDASQGPIVIMDNATIQPFSHIQGPCFIGEGSTIHSHATIASSYIGPHCKIGGEVKNSIIQAYSNKSHDGYIGNSLTGEWVNLGAGTTVSNLKLSYSDVNTHRGMTPESMASDQLFLGAVLGDFVKTGIQTAITCGSVIGSACSLYGHASHPAFVPPFTWGQAHDYKKHDINAFVTTLDRMMKRRHQSLSQDEVRQFTAIYDHIVN
jgi:UDP-N-acetylglucosamine diphosphorylase/glucosamine-1-phosphate N-acetyltransferase